MGDPAGVGPEVILRTLAERDRLEGIEAVVFGDRQLLARLMKALDLSAELQVRGVGSLGASAMTPGRFTTEGGLAQGAYLKEAADALERGEVDALVTGPIHKRALVAGDMPGPGQTEWLASRFGGRRPVMLLSGPRLKVVLATTHLPLSQVALHITREDLLDVGLIACRELRRYFFPAGPRLAVCALNPHGEVNGEVGYEEREIIGPAVEDLRRQGVNAYGPFPGDAIFARAAAGKYDAVLAMYHDQGLAPLKVLHFNSAVNVTLGLGIVRTSPDHGVAYDIAHKGQADPTSMTEALLLAVKMVERDKTA
ncbi:MAG TPA: 4-hydroxythreonine-4-phosphate dehydrogenase PdxA [Myxococcota bacterium]|nr:4-hydroxythreonine-4-phosphate dehydrogenase PdxA [Myxococcota bacterium]